MSRHVVIIFSECWVVDDTAFRAAFGTQPTPLDDALAATARWHSATGHPTPPHPGHRTAGNR